MAMNRRRYLTTITAAVGSLGLAGCSSNSDEAETNTPNTTPTNTATEAAPGTVAEGSPETATANSPETATEGSSETAPEGSPETATEGSPETAAENSPETATEISPETVTENSTGTVTGPESQYSMSAKQDMLLSVSAFPDGWGRDDSLNDSFDAVFANSNRSAIVLLTVEIFEDIAAAEDRIQTARSGVSEANDYDIADESFWATTDAFASTLFRHSNAVGQAAAIHQPESEVVPDPDRSKQYTQDMYEHWKTA